MKQYINIINFNPETYMKQYIVDVDDDNEALSSINEDFDDTQTTTDGHYRLAK